METFYKFQTDINQEAGAFSPNIQAEGVPNWGAQSYFEGKLFSDPSPGVSIFAKMRLNSKNTGDDLLRYAEGHVSFRKEAGGKKAEWLLFENQGRFSLGEPLLGITQQKSDLRGTRLDISGWDAWMHLYQARFLFENSDVYAFRTGRNFFKKENKHRLMLGTTSNFKGWSNGYNRVHAVDVTLRFGDAEWVTAGSASSTTNATTGPETLFETELKNLYAKTERWGGLRVSSKFRNWASGYENYLGHNPQNREIGVKNEIAYEVPAKFVNVTYEQDIKRETRLNILNRPERRTTYRKGEVYSEFKKGYKAKFYYEVSNDPWNNDLRKPGMFMQLESLAKNNEFKAHIRVTDMSNRYRKNLFGIQNTFNFITDEDREKKKNRFALKFILRVLHAFEYQPDLSRTSLYGQLWFAFGGINNLILAYGNQDHGNDDLTRDGSFADNSVNTDRIAVLKLEMEFR
ncbi:MAG: hypothetical protein A3G34_09115 [Candidatus Lindowbacteria bacterium RIFCSPLOWO2_12_FULL_62_27]|nr:MAG: hypothetical protein A3G34_09115 [Candidatus Lindowbacteria bacterium RIFCSPLOWO2_12_FULL_62_27]